MREQALQAAVERIAKMEQIFDTLRQAETPDPELLRQLRDYYEGGQWRKDYELDEKGLLPKDLKRGVLSQDGVWNYLEEIGAPEKPALHTARLCLRSVEEGDRAALMSLLTNEEVGKTYMVPDLSAPEAWEKLFSRLRELSLRRDRFVYAVCLDGEAIGLVNDVGMEGDTVEFGYAIHPAHRNRGYAAEALAAVIEAAFAAGFAAVRAGAFAENEASLRVMEKCGMKPIPYEETVTYRGAEHRCLYREIRRADEGR